ncbi:hypothetical protein BJ508DRAFT_334510 [Ascobolus immersus RN42]|uniref:Uncharacterized protein n=1 Tax=Ascobolus immersus RN42 TaxID=1160509 RepID=A0A3N4HFQ7_ASCIM|nr:hypothetical protein BJ508DRAFT_334510 [Ascobolus immersus RN42]
MLGRKDIARCWGTITPVWQIKEHMPLTRFMQIRRYFHIYGPTPKPETEENSNGPDTPWYYKSEPLAILLRKAFQQHFDPGTFEQLARQNIDFPQAIRDLKDGKFPSQENWSRYVKDSSGNFVKGPNSKKVLNWEPKPSHTEYRLLQQEWNWMEQVVLEGSVLCWGWNDNAIVTGISTIHAPITTEEDFTVTKRNCGKNPQPPVARVFEQYRSRYLPIPDTINMNGVDTLQTGTVPK